MNGWTLEYVRSLPQHEYDVLIEKLHAEAERAERLARRR